MARPVAAPLTRIRSAEFPIAWADWPDLRVRCGDCRNKSGYMCAALKTSCNASGTPFYCDSYSARGKR